MPPAEAPPPSGRSEASQPISLGSNLVQPPQPYFHATINRQDFQILMEGAGTSSYASARHVCLGVFFTSLVGALSLCVTCDFTKTVHQGSESFTVLLLKPCLGIGVFILLALVSLVIWWLFRSRAKGDRDRDSYREVVDRLKKSFGMGDAPTDSPG
jgi:hypothetical protein